MPTISKPKKSETRPGLRPPLKWAGGKRWLVPLLQKVFDPQRDGRLVEPFLGAAAVSLGLQPGEVLANDSNRHLINFFRQVQRGFVISSELPLANNKLVYYEMRTKFNALIQAERALSPEGASLFYYLNRTGFNGLCRFNSKGFFNVPCGRYRTINYVRDFRPYQPLLSHWEIHSTDFASLALRENDFVYADPPYDVEFTKYDGVTFAWEDQVRLAEWLSEHPGPVVISNQATNRITKLYRSLGFKLRYIDGPRRIACNGNRKPAREVLAIRGLGDRDLSD